MESSENTEFWELGFLYNIKSKKEKKKKMVTTNENVYIYLT